MGDQEQLEVPESKRRLMLGGGAVAGMIGGVAIMIVMMIAAASRWHSIWVGLKIPVYPFFPDRALLPTPDAPLVVLGLILHLAIGSLWGVLFGIVSFGLPRKATIGAGLLLGAVTWLVMSYVVLPLSGAGLITRATPVPIAIIEHVIFGLAVGLGFLPFQRERPDRRLNPLPRIQQREA